MTIGGRFVLEGVKVRVMGTTLRPGEDGTSIGLKDICVTVQEYTHLGGG